MPGNVSAKIDAQPLDPGSLRTVIAVYDPTTSDQQAISSTGAVRRSPGGTGAAAGANLITGIDPIWMDNANFVFTTNAEKVSAGRPVDEIWATLTVCFLTSKPYRAGMVLQNGKDGQVFEVYSVENSQENFRKRYLSCRAVS